MSSIVTILVGIAKALGLVDDLLAALKSHQDKMQGRADQVAADTVETSKVQSQEASAAAQSRDTEADLRASKF